MKDDMFDIALQAVTSKEKRHTINNDEAFNLILSLKTGEVKSDGSAKHRPISSATILVTKAYFIRHNSEADDEIERLYG